MRLELIMVRAKLTAYQLAIFSADGVVAQYNSCYCYSKSINWFNMVI